MIKSKDKIKLYNMNYIEDKIKTLTENNNALNLRVKTLNGTIKEKDNEISFLKS